MGRPNGDEMKSIKQKLLHLQEFLLLKPDLFQLFNSSAYGSKDLLLKDSTVKLIDVKEKNSTEAWLGEKYFKALKTLRSCQTVAAAARSFAEKLKTWKVGQLLCFYLVLFFFPVFDVLSTMKLWQSSSIPRTRPKVFDQWSFANENRRYRNRLKEQPI